MLEAIRERRRQRAEDYERTSRYGWSRLNKILFLVVAVLPYIFSAYMIHLNEVNLRSYNSLLTSYQELRSDCATAEDCTTDTPNVDEVQTDAGALPGQIGPTGAQGPRGEAGRAPSSTEVLNTIQQYCSENNWCFGASGADGVNGVDGVPGAEGPPGDDGVSGADGLPGAQGPAGPAGAAGADGANGLNGTNGTNGADGRGIVSVTCEDDGSWLVTYTDGTTSTPAGTCRVGLPEILLPDDSSE